MTILMTCGEMDRTALTRTTSHFRPAVQHADLTGPVENEFTAIYNSERSRGARTRIGP